MWLILPSFVGKTAPLRGDCDRLCSHFYSLRSIDTSERQPRFEGIATNNHFSFMVYPPFTVGKTAPLRGDCDLKHNVNRMRRSIHQSERQPRFEGIATQTHRQHHLPKFCKSERQPRFEGIATIRPHQHRLLPTPRVGKTAPLRGDCDSYHQG